MKIEHAGNKELSSTGELREVECQMSSQPRTSFVKTPAEGKRQNKTAKESWCRPKEEAEDAETPRPTRRKVPVPALQVHLPTPAPVEPDSPRCFVSMVPGDDAEQQRSETGGL